MRRSALAVFARIVVACFALICAAPLHAQVRDTLRTDTLRADTLAQDTAARPAVLFPAMPISGTAGVTEGVWIWDRDALLRETPISIVDLLARIPGVTGFRAGMFVQPEAAAGFGGTAGRVEVELDGYTLDPLSGSTTDLSRIPLAQLREVRVERRLGVLRIRLLTDQPTGSQPYTRIEAGVAQPQANLFRGLFLVPRVMTGPLALAVERVDTDGRGRAEPANVFTGWGKWGWTSERRGLQLELLRSTLRREPGVPWPTDRVRQDIVLRGRNTFATGLLGEVYFGRSILEDKPWRTDTDTGEVRVVDRDLNQIGARLAWQSTVGTVSGALRYRDRRELPRTEARIDARLALGPASVAADLTGSSWQSGESATSYGISGQLRAPFGGAVFAELTGGTRGAPNYRDSVALHILSDRDGWRVGAALTLGSRATGSIALINLDQDRAHPFGLPFDSAAGSSLLRTARGIEAFGRLVLLPGYLAVESWITNWTEAEGWTYLPSRSWRTALELHTLPLPSGNLEILGRLEGAHRSGMLAYNPAAPPEEPDPAFQGVLALPAYTLFNAYLQIRIIDVRMWLRYEDLLGNDVEDLPGRFHRGPRIMYGVKWALWN